MQVPVTGAERQDCDVCVPRGSHVCKCRQEASAAEQRAGLQASAGLQNRSCSHQGRLHNFSDFSASGVVRASGPWLWKSAGCGGWDGMGWMAELSELSMNVIDARIETLNESFPLIPLSATLLSLNTFWIKCFAVTEDVLVRR